MAEHRQFFRHMGISEILFWWRGEDLAVSKLSNGLNQRSIVYYIRHEEVAFKKTKTLEEVRIELENNMSNS